MISAPVLALRTGDTVRATNDGYAGRRRKPKPPVHHERAIAEDSPIRKYVDTLAPTGSKQRELMKVIARKLQGKSNTKL